MHTKTPNRSKNTRVWLIISVLAVVVAEAAFVTMVVRSRGLFEYIGLDTLPRVGALSLFGSSAIFVLAAFTLSIGEAHDILGMTLLACLVAVTTVCVLGLHSVGKLQVPPTYDVPT